MKSIHLSKLWQGAVFAFTVQGAGGRPVVWYHCDFCNGFLVHYTAIHTNQSYEVNVYDRNVWLRS